MPLDHQSLREAVVDALRQSIIDGDLAPGERLVEERLAERLGVSRNPIREAIRTLESMGLITVIPRRGAYVADLDVKDIRLMQEVLVTLDRWIVQAAAIRHDRGDILEMDKCLRLGREASEAGDLIAAAEQHRLADVPIEMRQVDARHLNRRRSRRQRPAPSGRGLADLSPPAGA